MYDPDLSTPSPLAFKKSRCELGLTARQRKHLTPSHSGYYLEKRGLEYPSTE